jgi:hypothetical protein
MMFDGFTRADIRTSRANIITVYGGSGPPLLLLYGYPQTHVTRSGRSAVFGSRHGLPRARRE